MGSVCIWRREIDKFPLELPPISDCVADLIADEIFAKASGVVHFPQQSQFCGQIPGEILQLPIGEGAPETVIRPLLSEGKIGGNCLRIVDQSTRYRKSVLSPGGIRREGIAERIITFQKDQMLLKVHR